MFTNKITQADLNSLLPSNLIFNSPIAKQRVSQGSFAPDGLVCRPYSYSPELYQAISSFSSLKDKYAPLTIKEDGLFEKQKSLYKLESSLLKRECLKSLINSRMAIQLEKSQKTVKTTSTIDRAGPKAVTSEKPRAPHRSEDLTSKIESLILFMVENMKAKQACTEAPEYCKSHPLLQQLYDKLSLKYFSVSKSRADIIRYIVRKVFKHIKTGLMKKYVIGDRQASVLLYKKYFKVADQGKNLDLDSKNAAGTPQEAEMEEHMAEFFMPYKKQSKNKTINLSFLKQIFASELFCEEYKNFLAGFGAALKEENMKKVKDLTTNLLCWIQHGSFDKIARYTRIPWLDSWSEETEQIAHELLKYSKESSGDKNIKRA